MNVVENNSPQILESTVSIADFIKDKTQQNLKTETVSLRLPAALLGDIDDLAVTLNVNRQELLYEFVSEGLKTALAVYEEQQNKPTEEFLDEGDITDSSPRYFVLNTNKRNDPDEHQKMVTNGIAAAFSDPWKYKIDKLRKGDTVFLYENGVGIVGFGKASGQLEVDGEKHQQKLTDYRRAAPLHAREIKKLIGHNMVFLQTMFKAPAKSGALIEGALSQI